MPIAQLLNLPATIVHRDDSGDEDDYGNAKVTETRVDTVCELQRAFRATEEDERLGETSDTLWNVYLPAGTLVSTAAALEIDGQTFELVGEPWAVRNPRTGVESHMEARVRRVAGAGDAS